ncbi:centromere protein F [Megalops cyprinoides]|uniref:centromere protein F n=1 Tax=Megalops cyprinoides TaxID=118141 RepID=UPI0018651871|nr:centromere protein F [Megalops cyprinoides]
MSWALEDWVAGLSGRALQKVRELQDHQERLQRERQQRQVQLDNAEAALNKQKLKYEEVRAELVGVQRDLQSTQEEVQAGARVQDRLIQELQVKQAQVCSLQGQLDSAHSLSHSLAQEVKRLKAELEKLQNASSSGDSVLFSTPYWNMSTPQEHNRSWWERDDGHGGGADGKHVRQQLQFLDCSPKAVLAGASPLFPRQRHSTLPSRCSSSRKDHSTSSGVFPWEREEASSVSRGQPATLSPSGGDVPDYRGHRDCGKEDLSNENEIQRSQILKLQTWVQSLEQEIRSASDQLRESETRLAEVQGDLAARDQNLNQAREELDQANTRIEKERDRAQMAEQQVKQLQDELSCQRQNAESSRRSAEQRRKDLEREHQKELSELEKERQCMERQHQQESSKLNQELQQARTLHNTLQAQYDKMLLQKQSVEKYLDTVKGKLEWTEKELQEAQKKETQTQSKLMEALRERDSLSVNMEQSSQRVRGLEEEVKRLTKELAAVLSNLAEVQAKPAIPAAPVAPVQFTPAGDNFLCSVPPTCDRRHCPPHAQRKKAERQNRVREEDLEHRVKYLADRMPCEGIDSEHTGGFGPSMQERPRGERGRGRCTEDGGGSLMREEEDERGENKKCSGICETGVPDTRSKEEDDTAPRVTVKVQKQGCSNGDADTPLEGICTSSGELHNMPSLEDLRKENVGLWDKLREAERKLELRLEDLQTHRMAESEARTKLKQLSHKHSSQAEQLRHKTQELWEEGGRLEKQLEEERSKSSRLTEALATLELDFRKEQVEREKEKAMEKAKSDKLTADMAVLESELRKAQEGRERERKEEERQRLINEEHRRAVMERLIELEMELEEWRGRWQNVNDGAKKTFKLLALGYSTNENFNKSDITFLKDNDVIPFPHECPPISDSANQQKTLETGKINSITKEAGHTVEPPRQKTVADLGTPLIERGKEEQMKSESATDSDEMIMLLLEVEQLRGTCEAIRGERDQEAGRAKQAQAKLEVLQSQVTSQTKQLTLGFEKQSRHIEDLLEELQDRDTALQRLEEELQGCLGGTPVPGL